MEIPAETIERLRTEWAAARAAPGWLERHHKRDEHRKEAQVAIVALYEAFRDAKMSVEQLRETFDHKTRNDWDVFGLKGLSGAMFLNQMVKYIDDREGLTIALISALAAPKSETDGRERMRRFERYIADYAVGSKLQVARTPFFLSAWWHLQNWDQWPVYYPATRRAFQKLKLFEKTNDIVDSYFRFRSVFVEIAARLELTSWELEHLTSWLERDEAGDPGPSEGSIAPSSPNEPDDEGAEHRQAWLIAPGRNARYWDQFQEEAVIGIGDIAGNLARFETQEQINEFIRAKRADGRNPFNDTLACWQFAREMNIGDEVFVKRGRSEIIGYGIIRSDYRYEPGREPYPNVRKVEWRKEGSWQPRERPFSMKMLTEIGRYPGLMKQIRLALDLDDEVDGDSLAEETETPAVSYSLEEAAEELFIPRDRIENALTLLKRKKNLVVQGPPGTGKTFFASRLAWLLNGSKARDQILRVQFHQAYSYEDFVQGFRPKEGGGFERRDGSFIRFCDQALQDQKASYVVIIDEINRGNLSKVFGELLMLVEADKRSEAWGTTLAYAREDEPPFHVPPNLFLIGTMNTADRSLAMVDYALRRRFAFVDLRPGFETEPFAKRLAALGAEPELRERIRMRMRALNDQIAAHSELGDGFVVGHSYFCHATPGAPCDERWYASVIENEIGPLLHEYWFDDNERAETAIGELLAED